MPEFVGGAAKKIFKMKEILRRIRHSCVMFGMNNTRTTPADYVRQSLNLIFAPIMWLSSSLGFFVDGARDPSGLSELTYNPLVPLGPAFAIWFPIFVGCAAYAVVQAVPRNRGRQVYRASGWWTALGFIGVNVWGVATSSLDASIVEAAGTLIFIPTMVLLVVAMVKLSRRRQDLNALEQWIVLAPIALIAGWCSLAVFVGLNAVVWNAVEPMGWSLVGTSITVLALGLGWVVTVLQRGAANRIYAFPVIWGLAFLAYKRLGVEVSETAIGWAAILGILLVIAFSVWRIHPRVAGYEN